MKVILSIPDEGVFQNEVMRTKLDMYSFITGSISLSVAILDYKWLRKDGTLLHDPSRNICVRFEPVAEFSYGIISVKYHSRTDIYY
jgi:hypothetical protein